MPPKTETKAENSVSLTDFKKKIRANKSAIRSIEGLKSKNPKAKELVDEFKKENDAIIGAAQSWVKKELEEELKDE